MISARHICLPVTAPPGSSWPTWYVSAWLTVPDTVVRNELQILVHGAGADHRYWDWPLEPDRYSYVRWAAARGMATLNIDRIGCGHSSHPPGIEVDVAAQVHAVRQVTTAALAGEHDLPTFGRVVLVGHSMGSVICGAAARECAAIDALVLTGYLPVDGTPEMGDDLFDFAFVPALDGLPHLRGIVDDGYLVPRTDLGVDALRYWPSQTDSHIMDFDTTTRGPATRAELSDAAVAGPAIRAVSTSTLAVIGQFDNLLIDNGLGEKDTHDTVRRVSAGIGPNFEFVVIPDTGHMLNLHRNAGQAYTAVADWLAR